jgi:hypothetical protein
VRYPLAGLLAVAVCAVLASATTFAAIVDWAADLDPPAWARPGYDGRVPAATTVWRLLVRVDADVLSAVLTGWLREHATTAPAPGRRPRTVIAVDGKVQRGARLPDGRRVHQLSAYDTAAGIVLAQLQIAAKSNEIPAFTPLLDRVTAQLGSLTDTVIVADALHAQSAHARDVHVRSGHLMVQVKAHQPTRHDHLKKLPWVQVPVGTAAAIPGTAAAKPARSRRSPCTPRGGLGFPHAQQAIRITRTRTIGAKTSRETAYPVVSLPAAHAQPADLQD